MIKRIIAGMVALLTCCSASAIAAEKPLTVAMTTWVGYGLLHLAREKGFFAKNKVDVSLITVQDKPATAAAIATGRLDGWSTTVDTFIFYNARKLGIKQVLAVDFSKGGEGIVADAGIKTIDDLRGHTIAAEEGSSTYFFLLNVLADSHMSLSDINLKPMRAGDAGAAFAAGRLEAAATWDPWLSKAAERGGHILITSADKPGLIADTVAFREEVIASRPDDISNFITAYFEAYDYWAASPKDANAIMAQSLGVSIDEFMASLKGLEFVSREANEQYIGTRFVPGQINEVTTRGIAFYAKAGLLKEGFDAPDAVDPAPLAAALGK